MKKFLLILSILICGMSVFAGEKTRQDYIEELKEMGYLYGCTPANWSLAEPVRGGFNWAAMHGNLEIMDLEVKAGLNINSCGDVLPLILIQKKQIEALDFLFKNGYNPDGTFQGYTYLFFAEHYKDVDAVNVIVDNGADVNIEKKGYNHLNYSIKKKNAEIVEILLKAGAKPNEKTKKLVEKTKNQEIKELLKDL